ncbi:hypothetical protein OC834_004436 [Tilletia horrida]|nr:hypothetical protein OC834_004436 [Tilletia horrida]
MKVLSSLSLLASSAALFVAAATPAADEDLSLAERATKCPGGQTGIISPKAGDTINPGKEFNFVFCSSVYNAANTIEIQVGLNPYTVIAYNLPPTKGRIYNTTLVAYGDELGSTLSVYEVRRLSASNTILKSYSVNVVVGAEQYYPYYKK